MADYECTAETPSSAYTFNKETNTIEKYDHDHKDATKHLVIPSEFNIDGVCYPVLNIGKGAFMVGDYFHVVIPEGIKYIRPEAFEHVDKVITITLPGSMGEFHAGGKFENIIVNGSSGSITIHGGGSSNITYKGSSVSKDYEYTITGGGNSGSGGSVTIHEYKGTDRVITIPSYIEKDGVKYPVETIEEGAYQGKGLISVVLPEGLKRIEDYAFARNQLIEVNIPKSVEHIGHYAFAFNEVYRGEWETSKDRIPTIKSVKIFSEGENVQRYGDVDTYGNIVGEGVTYDTATMKTVVGTTDLLKHVFIQDITNSNFDVVWGEVNAGGIIFDGKEYDKVDDIPDSNLEWFTYSLSDDGETYSIEGFTSNIKELTIDGEQPRHISLPNKYNGKNITNVDSKAFEGKNLMSVILPNKLVDVGDYSFSGNDLNSILLPKTLVDIGTRSFYDNNITNLDIPDSVKVIRSSAFSKNRINSLTLTDKINTIGTSAFSFNEISKVRIPTSIDTISFGLFSYNKLTHVNIPDNINVINNSAFRNNELEDVIIPDSVKIIEAYAFISNKLTKVELKRGTRYVAKRYSDRSFDQDVDIIIRD